MLPKVNKQIYFISQWVRQEPVKFALKELQRSLHYTLEELENLQRQRIKNILMHACQTVPFYMESLKSYKKKLSTITLSEIPELMNELPELKKQDILLDRSRFVSTLKFKTHTNISSGTTGEPFAYPCDQISWAYRHASIIRCLEMYNVEFGSRYAYFFGQHWKNELRLKTKIKDEFFNRDRFSAFTISSKTVLEGFNNFKKNRVSYFFGYPSTMVEFCQICQNELDIDPALLNLKMVLATGETLEDFQKNYLQKSLKCLVVNYYGSAEGGAGAFQGPEGYMHENMETTYVEVNSKGNLVKTDLFLRQFPMIKIATSDICMQPLEQPITKLKHRVLGKISGRTGEKIILPNGTKMHAVILDYFFDLFINDPNVLRFRFEFGSVKVVLFIESPLLELTEDFKTNVAHEFSNLFKGVEFEIRKVSKIDFLPNGKHRPWVQV